MAEKFTMTHDEKVYVGLCDLIEREATESGFESFMDDPQDLIHHVRELANSGIVDKEEFNLRVMGDTWYLKDIPEA